MTTSSHDLSPLASNLDTVDSTTSLLKAMANENRLRVLAILHDKGEMSVTELQEFLGSLSQSALSQHLAVLRSTGMVKTRRESQTIWYSLSSDIPGAVLSIMLEHAAS